jgi:serine/threonine protein kinase
MKELPKTTDEAIKLISKARTPADLFNGAGSADAIYKGLAKLVHPDKVPGKLKARATEAFTKLNAFHEFQVNGAKPKPFVATKVGKYIVKAPFTKGDIADLYLATNGPGSDLIFKIARSERDNDLLEAEAAMLKKIREADKSGENFKHYIPKLVDSFKASGRRVNITDYAEGHISLKEILAAYPDGLDFRHVVWMMNRLLAALGYIHKLGIVHGAVLPEHLLYNPVTHGLILADWCYSVDLGKPIKAIPAGKKPYYPPEVKAKKPAIAGTDIYLAAETLLRAAEKVPRRFKNLLSEWCVAESPKARPQDAWIVQDKWVALAKQEFGEPKYLKLELPVN